ncbi:PREDICTED: galactose-3-O-sulfotransferase 2-like [Branchiostoma belcheri]|uniref:Galactose-3-O-sulfotransferase 2-like n=1 Tax=Branchiostoma belcheri TaxID=7741 RepID=A0A6P5A065_BRABE|nr:PREDICTED: galactose-3-O-sulfotransferase 2-like [Branchiostoma belcheri]XP_019639692.1 PREDICTED: galactose-3-O-sulfotransferase 2-like [Branchiostoma belcheri]XP_019639693.1 PREDICTED: galactose-3-O-sulfotransferase 2-like [Branchiostoma belcheri]XP_019639694.1 PREDICTED: galactose-3-O-sulfotransferase 2-like [Branchiostoma belcheri]
MKKKDQGTGREFKMAETGKVNLLWWVLLCLIILFLLDLNVNFTGQMWDQLDMATSKRLQKQRQNSSDAVFGGQGRLVTAAENVTSLPSLPSELRTMGQNWSLSSGDSCTKPVTNFVFIKVHKTGSDSTAVILLRFAYNHHMTMCYGTNGMRLTFPRTEIYKTNCARWKVFENRFNFLVQHTVFNKTLMDRIMTPGTRYIGIMREPLSHFRSQFFYFEKPLRYGLTKSRNPLGDFLDNPERYEHELALTENIGRSRERNKQAYVMGFPPHLLGTQDTRLMDNLIKQLDQWYTFVIISEYYDESLVMLRRRLCWGLFDILHANKKVNKQHNRQEYVPLTVKQLENHRRINTIDLRMYDFFNRTFWRSVEQETRKGFWEEVTYFKEVVKRVNTFCSKRTKEKHLEIPTSKWNKPFSVNGDFCGGLSRNPKIWAKKLFDQMVQSVKKRQHL